MLMSRRRMIVGFFGVLVSGFVIAFLVVLSGGTMGFCSVLVVLSSFVVCVFRHGKNLRPKYNLGRSFLP